jgi:hypothetical protein
LRPWPRRWRPTPPTPDALGFNMYRRESKPALPPDDHQV